MQRTTKMRVRNMILPALLALTLASCGGDEDAFSGGTGGGTDGGTTPPVAASSLTLVTDTPSIPSAGSTQANITAYVKDANNNLLPGVLVQFNAPSGSVAVTQATTDSTGAAKATLSTVDNPDNRSITVTATAGSVTSTVDVRVAGTTVDLQGPDALVSGTAGNYTVVLANSAGAAVAAKEVTLQASGGTLSAPTLTTDGNGRATFTLTPSAGGTINLTVSGAGATKAKTVTVSADSFAFTAPAADKQVSIGTSETFTVDWKTNGVAIANGSEVTFTTTRGTLSANSATTAGGTASVTLSSSTAGEAVVTATGSGGSAQRRVYFVATTAATVDLQASPFTVQINNASSLTATVRDSVNNLVANKTVKFELTDSTGGSLSVGTATTDLQGRATTVYTASSTSSALGGVTVKATVTNPNPSAPQPPTLPSDEVQLTVAGTASSVVFGTGNKVLSESNDTLYRVNYTALIKDITGAGVGNVPVTITVEPVAYRKGGRVWSGTIWETVASTTPDFCVNEDTNLNGIFDPTDNDENQNGTLQPGGAVTVTQGASTDSNGFLPFSIVYAQDHTDYVRVRLRARTSVQGSEFESATQPFWLQGAADDFNKEDVAPPGPESPFGTAANCSDQD